MLDQDPDSTPISDPTELPPAVEPSPAPGSALLAWVVILTAVTLAVWRPWDMHRHGEQATASERISLMVFQVQARALVGAAWMDPKGAKPIYAQARELERGTLGQRTRFVVLAGELAGPPEALGRLNDLEDELAKRDREVPAVQRRVLDALHQLYAGRPLNGEQQELLDSELGWFGELALAPADGADPAARAAALAPAQRTLVVLIVVVGVLLLLGLAGFFGLMLFTALGLAGQLHGGLQLGSRYGAVYAETFAIWMLLFLGLQAAAGLVQGESRMLAAGLASLGSMAALLWPVLRGASWRQVREDVGLTLGRRGLLEPLFGPICYVIALPIVAVGIVATVVLMLLKPALAHLFAGADAFAPVDLPAHPVVELLAGANWAGRLQLLFLGCVAAPIVEETMFRGVLHRHLREATGWMGPILSVGLSATVVSFLFAVIHPQGWVAVPALMGMAYGLSLAREWRGTLLPGIVMHGLSNGLVMTLGMVLLSE